MAAAICRISASASADTLGLRATAAAQDFHCQHLRYAPYAEAGVARWQEMLHGFQRVLAAVRRWMRRDIGASRHLPDIHAVLRQGRPDGGKVG